MLRAWMIRYSGIAIQFGILSILARHLSPADFGRYMIVLSIVTPLHVLLGLGVSETFVREAPQLLHDEETEKVASLVGAAFTVVIGMSVVLALLVGGLLWIFPVDHATAVLVGFVVAMIIATGVAVNGAHLLLGAGFETLGTFFFYWSINLSILSSSVPYVLLAKSPSFSNVALINSVAALCIGVVALLLVAWRVCPRRADLATMHHMARIGIRLASTRTLRQGGSWMPTFIAGATVGPVPAGYLGLASRTALLVAVPTQTLRFAARPAIVRAHAEGDFQAIKKICGRPAGVAVAIALIAIAISALAGPWLITFGFGPNLAPAAPVLTVILIGVAIEAAGGVADEVLKMAGHEKLVLTIVAVCVAGEFLGLVIASRFGVLAMAWVVAGYFAALSAATVIAARIKLGVWLRPYSPVLPKW